MGFEHEVKKQYADKAMLAGGAQLGCIADAIQMPTVGQNIDNQIQRHQEAINRLEATRANLDKANLLNLKISDLREAMNY
jgi:hypothetical protein